MVGFFASIISPLLLQLSDPNLHQSLLLLALGRITETDGWIMFAPQDTELQIAISHVSGAARDRGAMSEKMLWTAHLASRSQWIPMNPVPAVLMRARAEASTVIL